MIRELELAQHSVAGNPGYRVVRAKTVALAVLLHVVVLGGLLWTAHSAVRIGSDTPAQQHGINAFVIAAPRPRATTGVARPVPPVERTPPTPLSSVPLQSAGAREEAAGGRPDGSADWHSE